MPVIAFDTETKLIRPGCLAPEIICLTWQMVGHEPRICDESDAEQNISVWLSDPCVIFVGHNVAYDFAVICAQYPRLVPEVFAAYAADRVTDTGIRQKLLDIAGGVYRGQMGDKGRWIKHEYSLESLARRKAGLHLKKDGWRLQYASFQGIPLADWPDKARQIQAEAVEQLKSLPVLEELTKKQVDGLSPGTVQRVKDLRAIVADDPAQCIVYPLDDAKATLAVFQAQEAHVAFLDDQYRQARAAWWLHLSSTWGLRTDEAGVEILRTETQAAYDALLGDLSAIGLVRPDGTRDTKKAKARMLEVLRTDKLPIRRTDAHATCDLGDACDEHVSLDADACNASDDEVLINYAELSTLKKVLTNDVEALARGIRFPVHTRYGMAETGRTTSSGPNIQNLRRKAGIREAFVPRPGKVFAQADYPQLELYTLAQCCVSWLGQSKLAEALNAGMDPHLAMAAQILGITYAQAKARISDEDVDNARQTAKVANFGFPGGLGIQKLCLFAKKTYGVELSLADAKRLKEQWFATWPEMPLYFARVNAQCDTEDGFAMVETLFTHRIRGGATYCAACNNGFQALGADCAKHAGFILAATQYTDQASPLWNARTVAFVHDEFIVEVEDDARAHDAANELARLMRDGANGYLRDVPIVAAKMKPLLMRRWSKKAKPVYDVKGRLIPWS